MALQEFWPILPSEHISEFLVTANNQDHLYLRFCTVIYYDVNSHFYISTHSHIYIWNDNFQICYFWEYISELLTSTFFAFLVTSLIPHPHQLEPMQNMFKQSLNLGNVLVASSQVSIEK